MLIVLAVTAAGGCSFKTTNKNPDAMGSGSADAPSEGQVQPFCLGPTGWQVCVTPMPTNTVMLPATIDTSMDGMNGCGPANAWGPGNTSACVIVAGTIMVVRPGTFVTGSRPLVLAAQTVTIDGLLDVASHSGVLAHDGPAANSSFCQAPTRQAANTGNIGGGGAGGSFTTAGGGGGVGDNGNTTGAGSEPTTASPPALLRGGCPGSLGGPGDSAGTQGVVGDGGGAVYIAATTINFTGNALINASGAAAAKSGHHSGGNGGGSGGMIMVNAHTINASTGAILLANGGNGAAGGGGNDGVASADPDPTMPTAQQLAAMAQGGDGGQGFAGTHAATLGVGGSGGNGGGGGGGAGGFIGTNKGLGSAIVSPSATTFP
jgi:hypothetical protein